MLSELSAVVTTLAWAAPAVSPRPELREKLLARVRTAQAPPVPAPSFSMTRPPPGCGGVVPSGQGEWLLPASSACWGWPCTTRRYNWESSGVNQQLTEELVQERVLTNLIAHTDTRVAALASPQPTTPPAAGWIVWSPANQRGFMVVHYLPALPVGKTYQLWAITGQRCCRPGYFRSIQSGTLHSWCRWPSPILTVSRSRSNRREVWRCPVAP